MQEVGLCGGIFTDYQFLWACVKVLWPHFPMQGDEVATEETVRGKSLIVPDEDKEVKDSALHSIIIIFMYKSFYQPKIEQMAKY